MTDYDTLPPLSPALMAAISRAVEEGFGPISEAWGNAFVAQRELTERVELRLVNRLLAIDAKLEQILQRLSTHENASLSAAHPPNGK